MNELFFMWIAVLIQTTPATPAQVQSIRHAWLPSCVELGGELHLSGRSRIWNGKDAFVIEGQCRRGTAVPARNQS